ncbi:hypothetical protein O181_028443 [Austropuccinia psidii MF-1]|uniref:Tf2-1-like SH3-like domain-containing protein n=1 Tax=Austropuccinia psidii MF-1 TaxID=1389203 RepID=A0A9Q3CTS8_9BASI|nr:hypothetical protein [Austropuccinia psidii MF-1]
MVRISSKSIRSTTTKKLSERWLCQFPILKEVSNNSYQLKLQDQWKSSHPVFHISLKPVKTSTIPNRHKEPPPPIIIEEEEKLEVF